MSAAFPAATSAEHQAFCMAGGWTQVRDVIRGTGLHVTYEFTLDDGRRLRTRSSWLGAYPRTRHA